MKARPGQGVVEEKGNASVWISAGRASSLPLLAIPVPAEKTKRMPTANTPNKTRHRVDSLVNASGM